MNLTALRAIYIKVSRTFGTLYSTQPDCNRIKHYYGMSVATPYLYPRVPLLSMLYFDFSYALIEITITGRFSCVARPIGILRITNVTELSISREVGSKSELFRPNCNFHCHQAQRMLHAVDSLQNPVQTNNVSRRIILLSPDHWAPLSGLPEGSRCRSRYA